MTKRMLIDATHHEETRVVVMDGQRLTEFDYESQFRRQLKGNIFLAKVTRVEPSLQAAFVNFGGNRHGFLPFAEIHPDYYRIPVADREALIAEQRQLEEEEAAREAEEDAAEEARLAREAEASQTDETAIFQADGNTAAPLDSDEELESEPVEFDRHEQGENARELVLEETGYVHDDIELTRHDDLGLDDVDSEQDHDHSDDDLGEHDTADSLDDPHNHVAGDIDPASEDGTPPTGQTRQGQRRSWRHRRNGGRGRYMGARKPRDEISDEGPTSLHARFRRRYKIQEVIKRGQIMLIQVAKEERGNKGAAVTTYLSLPGRYCVLMPNSPRGGGVSRKIGNFADRRRLKSMLKSLEIPSGMSVILRTAGVERSEAEIKRDYDYLLRLWDNIREMTLQSTAPAPIYEEGDLIKRSIRDIYSRDVDELLVSGEKGYQEAREFMSVLMPGHEDRVIQYKDDKIPLFHRYQVENQITEIGEPIVQLKSGGYLVINQTEALVAVDVNSGRATKERHIEETALKTNLEAADEVARQLKLRDLGGLVVIDFIDMEDRRNNAKVERRLKDALASDRARIQVSRISTFGLLELSRQRLNPSLTEAQFQKCPHCHGFGFIRSIDSAAILALRALEDEGVRARTNRVTLHIPNDIAIYILNEKRDMLATIERRYGFNVMIHVDPSLAPSGYLVEALKNELPDHADDDMVEDDHDLENRERPARRKKPVAMEQALEESRESGFDSEQQLDRPDESDSAEENFNRADVEPDGDHGRRRNGGQNRSRRHQANRRGSKNSNPQGSDGANHHDKQVKHARSENGDDQPAPLNEEQGDSQPTSERNNDRPRRGKYGTRRGGKGHHRDQRGARTATEQSGGPNEFATHDPVTDPSEPATTKPRREDRPRPQRDDLAPTHETPPQPVTEKPKATYFIAKKREPAANSTTTVSSPLLTETVESARDPQPVDPNTPKKKGWWSKFS